MSLTPMDASARVCAGVDWAKDDRYDAYVFADVVRTDRRRLTPLARSDPVTLALRSRRS